MKGLQPLLKSVLAALNADGLLDTYMGGTADCFGIEAPHTQTLPYITVNTVSMGDWSSASFDGDEIQFQVAAHFSRGREGDGTGVQDVAKACERIRDILANTDDFDLDASPSGGGDIKRLVMCRYVSGVIIPGLNDDPSGDIVLSKARGQSISGVVTFRAIISPS
jgi:hypothetical protein